MAYLPEISAAIPQLCQSILIPQSYKALTLFSLADTGAGSADLDGEWLFKASLVLMATKLVVVSRVDGTTQRELHS